MSKAFQKNSSVADILKKASDSNLSANTDIIKEIDLDKIIENELNKFSMNEDIEFQFLKESINRTGVLQPVRLKKNENDTYTIIAGHRRIRASKAVDKKTVPAIVKDYNDGNDILDLVETNLTTRKLTDEDILSSIEILENLLNNSDTKIVGKTSEYIGKMLNMSGKQVERYRAVNNLIPEIKEKVINKEIGMSSVTGISTMSKKQQETALEEIKKIEEETGKTVTREQTKEIKKIVESVEKLIPELQKKIENKDIDLKAGAELSTLSVEKQVEAHKIIEAKKIETGKPVNKEKAKEIKKNIENTTLENQIIIEPSGEFSDVKKDLKKDDTVEQEEKIEDDELEDDKEINVSEDVLKYYKLQNDLEDNKKELAKHSRVIRYIYNELSKLNLSSLEKIKDEINEFEAAGVLPKAVEKEIEEEENKEYMKL